MPPKSAKKTPPGPGTKRGARANRGTTRAASQNNKRAPRPSQDDVAAKAVGEEEEEEEVSMVEEEEGLKVEQHPELESIAKKSPPPSKKEDIVREPGDEFEKGERLDLEDHEPEYEPEEYGGTDYDEKEVEPEEVQEEGDELEEAEGGVGEEEGGDLVGDEIEEEVHEELEDEEDEQQAEHMDMVDDDEQEHQEVFKERRKRKEFEIFVGGLDKDATEDDLRKVFSEVGEVTEVRLMMNPQTKKNKGFAFLRFATVEQAKRVCAELKNPVVNGKKCGVTPSQDSDTLFLGNICKTWTKEALIEKLKHYGVDNVEDVTLVEDSNSNGSNRGFAFLEFSSRSEAMDAFKLLQKRDVVFGVDRPAKVSFADSFIDPGDQIMAQVKTVFVDGLPALWDEDRVKVLLKRFGHVEKIELARNMPSAKRKDFGFVTFDSHDAAVTCAKNINNQELGEGEYKAKVRARLSRPLQRGKGKHAGRDYRPVRAVARSVRAPWSRPVPRSLPVRGVRLGGSRLPPVANRGLKRPVAFRDRRPVMSMPLRARPLPPPPRSYDRRPPAPLYPKGSMKREYARHDEPPARGRAPPEYSSRLIPERRPYREEYSSRGSSGSGYSDLARPVSRTSSRRAYAEDVYGQRFERPPSSHREVRGRDYDAVSRSKRTYSAIDDISPRYADAGVRQSRARLDYDLPNSGSHYGDAYSDRLGRSSLGGYSSSRTSLSGHDSHGTYGSRHGMSYSGGSLSGSDGGMYSSSFNGDYVSRESDVGSGSYSSLYSSRGLGGSSYMASGSSGSYY